MRDQYHTIRIKIKNLEKKISLIKIL